MKKLLSVLLAVLIMATSCVCAVPVSAAEGACVHDEISRTVYVYTAGENSTYTKTDYCYDANCQGKAETGNAGAANRCTRCLNRTLEKEEIVYANCIRAGYTEYTCTYCKTFREDFVAKSEHKFVKTVTPATCTTDGSTDYRCNCTKYGAAVDATKSDGFIPAKGHTIGKAGTTVTYEYFTELGIDKCRVSGACMDCDEPAAEDVKLYVIAEACPSCGSKVTNKTVVVPADCNEGATVTYECAKEDCSGATVTALPVGHEVKSTTYYYTNGEYSRAEVDCYRCGVKEIVDNTYQYDTKCVDCNSAIVTRTVVAPSCNNTGYTQTVCIKEHKCTEATRPMLSHSTKVGEWTYYNDEGVYTYGASCNNYGCFGYSSSGQIGILGKCVKCKATGKLTYKKVTFADCISREYTEFSCNQCCPGSKDLVVDEGTKAHNTVTDEKLPTCTEAGGTSTTCKNCYSTTTKETIPAKGHSVDISNKIYLKPAVDQSGNIIYNNGQIVYEEFLKSYGHCKVCNKDVETDLTNVPTCSKCNTGKIIQEVYVKPDCSVDLATGQKGTNGYTRVYCTNAACAENGYDGYYIPNESIIPFAHVYGDWTVTKSATCSEPGEKVRTCSLCGGEDKVVIPANRIDDGTPEGKPKHSLVVMEYGYAATCTTPGRTNYTYCSQCGDFFAAQDIPATGHQLSPGTSNENFCVLCNSYVLEEGENGVVCGCMCHNEDGLAKFFFKIIMFFCNIFGINQTCECGANHMETNSTTKK